MIAQIREWFRLALPEPTDKNRAVQLGCHFEEVKEMADTLGERQLNEELRDMADWLKLRCAGVKIDQLDRQELLDALCDQVVTAVGVAHMFGLDIQGALIEVNASNWSKFVDGKPQFDANGKIAKGPCYRKPDLSEFL